jgi:DNA repair protein RadC
MTEYVFEAGALPAQKTIRSLSDAVRLAWTPNDCAVQWLKFYYVNDENEVIGTSAEYPRGLAFCDIGHIMKTAANVGGATMVDIVYNRPGGADLSQSEAVYDIYEKLLVAFGDLGVPIRALIETDFRGWDSSPPATWNSDPVIIEVVKPYIAGERQEEIRLELGVDVAALRKYRETCPGHCLAPFPGVDTIRVELKKLRDPPCTKILGPKDARDLLAEMEDYDREHMKVLYLDGAGQVIGIENISVGILNQALVHPREVLKGAILASAASVIVVHNHPSGEIEPSSQDISISAAIEEACKLMNIRCLDFMIIGTNGRFASFKELGYMGRGHSDTLDAILKFNRPPGVGEGDDACSVAYRAALKTMEKYCGTKSQ